MTATSLNLGGSPIKFMGAYVKNISCNLGLSINPSTCNITVVEDGDFGVYFEAPETGSFHTITIGSNWSFSGIVTKYEEDLANIGGRTIRISLADPREIMKLVPVIIAPGYQTVVNSIRNTNCSVLDIYGAFQIGLLNLSGWNQSGMEYSRFEDGLRGTIVTFGETPVTIAQQTAKGFGEIYSFNISEITNIVSPNYRINTNLSALSNIIEELSSKHSFDWFVESERLSSNIIEVTVRIINRAVDNIDIGLQEMLNAHPGGVVSSTSGVELRTELSCMALQGAPVEQMTKVAIKGLANEPLDLTTEGGTNKYFMEEDEMRAVLAGKPAWEMWLGTHREILGNEDGGYSSLGGFSRYGGSFTDNYVNPLATLNNIIKCASGCNGRFNDARIKAMAELGDRPKIVGKVFDKLSAHAKKIYGKRWVHDDISDEIIQSAWTRDTITGSTVSSTRYPNTENPNSYFRQEDGRTRAYIEFSSEDSGGAFSLGLNNLTNLFGNIDPFRNVTRFGTTFSNVSSADEAIIQCELKGQFSPGSGMIETDKSNYIYDESDTPWSVIRTSLYVAATIDKDGVVTIDAPVMESEPNEDVLVAMAVRNAQVNRISTEQALLRMKYFYGTFMANIAGRCYQPSYAYIPTRSRYYRYGPVFPSALSAQTQGKLEIVQDDGFAPWEFGGSQLMIDAMQRKVDNAASLQKEAFSANIVVEGYPQYNIGDAIEKNANINSMSISFGDGGVKTTYSLQTFFRKFGEFSKEDWARISLLMNSGGPRLLPQQQINFIEGHRVGINKNYSGNGQSPSTFNGGARDFG